MTVRHSDSSSPAPQGRKRRSWLKGLLWLLLACVLLVLLAVGGLLVWASSDGSLPRALQLAQKYLPQEQRLEFDNAQGSITGGGSVQQLQWSMPGVAVDVTQLQLDWSLKQLLSRALDVQELSAERVQVRLTPTPDQPEADSTPFVMPEQISLPLHLSVPLRLQELAIESVSETGESQIQILDNINAHYRYDGVQHALQLHSLQYEQSHLQAQLSLGAHDLALQAEVGAWLAELAPDVPFAMQALVRANGSLAGGDAAALAVELDAHEQSASTVWQDERNLLERLPQTGVAVAAGATGAEGAVLSTPTPSAPAADAAALASVQLQAQLHPWRAQPVQTALLHLQRLNAQVFHAAAPRTDLNGSVRIEPDPAAGAAGSTDLASAQWQLEAQLRNAVPGAWDQQDLPVQTIKAQLHYAADLLQIEQADIVLHGTAPAGQVQLKGALNPQQLADAQVTLELVELNLQPLMQDLPKTAFSGQVKLQPLAGSDPLSVSDLAQAQWAIEADVRNAEPGLIDQQQIPLTQLLAKAQITPERWTLETGQAHVGTGQLKLQGFFEPTTQQLDVSGELMQLPLVLMHSELAAEQVPNLNGQLAVAGQLDTQVRFDVDIRNADSTPAAPAVRSRWNVSTLALKGQYSPTLLELERVHIDAFAAKVDGNSIRVSLPEADSIEAVLQATAPGLSLNADANMQHSSGGGKLALQIRSAPELLAWARGLPVIGNQLPAMKATGQAQIEADWQGGWQQWLAELEKPVTSSKVAFNAQARSDGLTFEMLPAQTVQNTTTPSKAKPAAGQTSATASAGTQAADDSSDTRIEVRKLQLDLRGNPAAASLSLDTDVLGNGVQAVMQTQAQLRQTAASGAASPMWSIVLDELKLAATLPEQTQAWTLQLAEPLPATVQTGRDLQLKVAAGQLRLTPPKAVSADGAAIDLQWQPIEFTQFANGSVNLQTQGQLQGLVVAWLDGLVPDNPPLKTAGIQTNLLLSGGWNVRMSDSLDIQAFLKRDSGDVWLGDPVVEQIRTGPEEHNEIVQTIKPLGSLGTAVGVKALELRAQSRGDALELTFDWDTDKAGVIDANVQTRLSQQDGSWTLAPTAPVSGRIQAHMQDLAIWTGLAPLGWRISGALNADINVAGQLNAPLLQGPIEANGLNLRSVLDGVELRDGRLRAQLAGNRFNVNELVFQGGTGSRAYIRGISGNRTPAPTERGTMSASGYVDWSQVATANDSGIAMDFKAQLDAMQVLVRSDRQVSLSGDLAATLQNGQMRVRGDINVVRASIMLPSSGAPTLGSDVVIVRSTDPVSAAPLVPPELQTAMPMDLNLKLNLGRDFALEGYGINTRLEGELTIRNTTRGNDPVSIVGEVRTDEGRYRAWGQALDVDTGVVLFNGPYDNPSINLLAVRPNTPIDITAGVRVTGTAQSPRVQLYSNPTMPDSETLSWVLLGRAPNAGSGDSNAMQQAALGLLANSVGGSLAEGFGFDSVGLGSNGLEIGKRLSDQLYVTYQSGLAGAATTFYVFYDITQRMTLRGQTGTDSAVDLIYTFSYDGKDD